MRKAKFRTIFIVLFFIFLFAHEGYPDSPGRLYFVARKNARIGRTHFAFIDLSKLVNLYPDSRWAENALFGVGEYYFSIGDEGDAVKSFRKFVSDYPESKARPFALAYLLKIAISRQDIDEIKEVEKEIISSEQLSFSFAEFRMHRYSSALYKKYRAKPFDERIEFYIDGELFVKIFY